MPLPEPTNTPCPTTTDGLLPMITLGCGEARLARVPSGQMIASPVKTPRLPSSQVTSVPWRVQDCASRATPRATCRGRHQDPEHKRPRIVIASIRLIWLWPLDQSSAQAGPLVQTARPASIREIGRIIL